RAIRALALIHGRIIKHDAVLRHVRIEPKNGLRIGIGPIERDGALEDGETLAAKPAALSERGSKCRCVVGLCRRRRGAWRDRPQDETHIMAVLDIDGLRNRKTRTHEQTLKFSAPVIMDMRIVKVDDRKGVLDVFLARQLKKGDAIRTHVRPDGCQEPVRRRNMLKYLPAQKNIELAVGKTRRREHGLMECDAVALEPRTPAPA